MSAIPLNARFFGLYARAHGRTPEEQWLHDRQDLRGYTAWSRVRFAEAAKDLPEAFSIMLNTAHRPAYERWLTSYVDRVAEGFVEAAREQLEAYRDPDFRLPPGD